MSDLKRTGSTTFRGPAWRMFRLPVGAQGDYGPITKSTPGWARIGFEKVSNGITLTNAHEGDHEYEGRVKIGGKSYSAFTSDVKNPDGGLGMIIIQSYEMQAIEQTMVDEIMRGIQRNPKLRMRPLEGRTIRRIRKLRVRLLEGGWLSVPSLEAASEAISEERDRLGVGVSSWRDTTGDVIDARGRLVARISYNGRIWADGA